MVWRRVHAQRVQQSIHYPMNATSRSINTRRWRWEEGERDREKWSAGEVAVHGGRLFAGPANELLCPGEIFMTRRSKKEQYTHVYMHTHARKQTNKHPHICTHTDIRTWEYCFIQNARWTDTARYRNWVVREHRHHTTLTTTRSHKARTVIAITNIL